MGLLTPEPAATQQLRTGQVGYVITGMKSTRSARLGDTWHLLKQPVKPLPGFKPIKSMVFAGEIANAPYTEGHSWHQVKGAAPSVYCAIGCGISGSHISLFAAMGLILERF